MSRAYYNEIDPYAAQWIKNLVAAGLVMEGDVDTRSILDVRPDDLAGYTRCHFFAGIAVWDHALALAGWPADRPVWTGSCPCQPFSSAGRGAGFADERHLWPAWFDLIRKCGPAIVFGEQVEAAVRLGWLDTVFSDLEGEGYACGASVFGAHSVGAPHIRQRLWFVADASGERRGWIGLQLQPGQPQQTVPEAGRRGEAGFVGLAPSIGREWLGHQPAHVEPVQANEVPSALGDADRIGEAAFGRVPAGANAERQGGFWSAADWLPCRDGKLRPVEPGTFPLAHGAPARVGRLRAYGNAINAEAAAAFIGACLDVLPSHREAA